jgi:hypothetical protein
MAKPAKKAKKYSSSVGRHNFLTPPPRKYYGFAPEGEKGYSPRPQQLPARTRSVKKTTAARKKK